MAGAGGCVRVCACARVRASSRAHLSRSIRCRLQQRPVRLAAVCPAPVAMRPAVSLVTMPPVPHCVPACPSAWPAAQDSRSAQTSDALQRAHHVPARACGAHGGAARPARRGAARRGRCLRAHAPDVLVSAVRLVMSWTSCMGVAVGSLWEARGRGCGRRAQGGRGGAARRDGCGAARTACGLGSGAGCAEWRCRARRCARTRARQQGTAAITVGLPTLGFAV
jgi:hypothetical protein